MSYEEALELLKNCSTDKGFIASAIDKDNYKRIFGRDSIITGLAALMTKDKILIKQTKKSLETLLKNQSETGQIPSNVSLDEEKVSYGGPAGRVDSNLWLVIGFSQYVKRTKDLSFLKKHIERIDKIMFLLKCYEFNNKNLIYTPKSGNWADEYLQEGYVLYDEVLYYRSLEEYAYLLKTVGKDNKEVIGKANKVKKIILTNFWPEKENEYVYHKPVFEKAVKKPYLLAYFNPAGYGLKFDGFGNSLALHFNILDEEKEKELLEYVKKHFTSKTKYLIPAFYPAIRREDKQYELLRNNYSHRFKNKPYEYHNGGLWPVITGFFASTRKANTEKYIKGINWANNLRNNSFTEFVNAKTMRGSGTKYLAWSAAGEIIARKSLEEEVFI